MDKEKPARSERLVELAEVEEVSIYPEPELIDESTLAEILPSMSVNTNPSSNPPEEPCIVDDGVILGLYDEILDNCRKDRERSEELLVNFIDMVINDGDSSSSSKEAVVNLVKNKSDINDKMSKIADLMTRIKLKDKDTFPRYLAQTNNVTIDGNNSKRDILKRLQASKKEKK
jgi:hypothetical protein